MNSNSRSEALRVLILSGWTSVGAQDFGGAKREWHLRRALEQSGLEVVTWAVAPDPAAPSTGEFAAGDRATAERVIPGRRRHGLAAKLAALVSMSPEGVWERPVPPPGWERVLTGFDAVLMFSPVTAAYTATIARLGLPLVLDLPDVPHQSDERISATLPGWVARRRTALGSVKWRRLERILADRCDMVVVVSDADAAEIRALSKTPVAVHANGVSLSDYPFVDHAAAGGTRVLYTGDFGYQPNIDAARWLAAEIVPRLRAARPTVSVTLVGRSASSGPWPDGMVAVRDVPTIQPYFDQADLFLAPIRAGGGTRYKLIEAFAKGVPVVATTIGAEGLDAEDGVHLLIADTAAELAAGTLRLLDDGDLRARLTANARRLVEQRHDWQAIGAAYAADIRRLAYHRSP